MSVPEPYWSTLTDISYLLDKGKTLTQKSWLEGGYLIVPRCSSCCFSILAMKPGFLCVWIFVVFHKHLSHTLPMSESPTTHRSTHLDLWGFRPVYRNTIMREKFVSRPGSRLSFRGWVFLDQLRWVHPSRRCMRKPPWFSRNLCKPVNNRNFKWWVNSRSILRISRLVKCSPSPRYLIPVYYCQTVNDVLCILYFLLTCTFMLTICMCNLSHPLSGTYIIHRNSFAAM